MSTNECVAGLKRSRVLHAECQHMVCNVQVTLMCCSFNVSAIEIESDNDSGSDPDNAQYVYDRLNQVTPPPPPESHTATHPTELTSLNGIALCDLAGAVGAVLQLGRG